MSNDFFFDGNYTNNQIEAINNINSQNIPEQTQDVNGNNDSIFDDINSYKNDKTKQTDNTELFNYIEKTMGMDNFLELLDADNDGEISKSEANKISSYDDNDELTSNDIVKFTEDIKDIKDAKTTEKNGDKTTEIKYETDKNGQLVKKSAVEKNTKTGEVTAEMTYENNNIKTLNDKIKNRTETFEYDNSTGKLKSSKLTMNDEKNTLMYESFYDEKGRIKNMREYVNEIWKTKGDYYHVFEYDENNRVKTSTVYKGTNDKGEKHAEYHYTYDDKTGLTLKREDGLSGEVLEYKYDDNNKLTSSIKKDKNGKITGYATYNPDGSIATSKEGDFAHTYKYADNGGLLKEMKTYKSSDMDDNGKLKENAEPVEEIEYDEDGKEKRKAVHENGAVKYYEGGELKAEVKGDYTYVYEKVNGKDVVKKYNNSDCENGVPKDGVSAISTEEVNNGEKAVDFAKTFLGQAYSWGGSHSKGAGGYDDPNPHPTDCSGLVLTAYYNGLGIDITESGGGNCTGHHGGDGFGNHVRGESGDNAPWERISGDKLQPGDIIVVPGHVVMYEGTNSNGEHCIIEENGTACVERTFDINGLDNSGLNGFFHWVG